jgi:hypothetical protein
LSRVALAVVVVGCSHGAARPASAPPAATAPTSQPVVERKPAGCDRARIERVLDAGGDLSYEAAATLAAEACPVSDALHAALDDVATYGCLEGVRHLDAMSDLLARTCPRGAHGLDLDAVVDDCELDRFGFATRAELEQSHHPACLLIGAMLYVELAPTGDPYAGALALEIAVDPEESARERRALQEFDRRSSGDDGASTIAPAP